MPITLNREQRDAIYSQLRTDITGFNDIELNLRAGDFEAARRQSQRMADDARLLDDLGWEDDPGREEFTLTMPPADLARLLSRLNDDAGPSSVPTCSIRSRSASTPLSCCSPRRPTASR